MTLMKPQALVRMGTASFCGGPDNYREQTKDTVYSWIKLLKLLNQFIQHSVEDKAVKRQYGIPV